ncbi:MAG: hypothetical protein IH626_13540 [Rhodospirillales bacterium]|nr:hypothetical protein [Rhodospirillales bacterium]
MDIATNRTGKRHHCGRLLALAGVLCALAPALAEAAERTATIRLGDREIKGARVPMKDVAGWKVTDLGSHRPTQLPVADIARIQALRMSGSCQITFGRVELAGGETVEIRANLRDIFDIPSHAITVTVPDPRSGLPVEESFPCDRWSQMDFDPPGPGAAR